MKNLYCSDIEGDALLDAITKVYCMSNTQLDKDNKTTRIFTLTNMKDSKADLTCRTQDDENSHTFVDNRFADLLTLRSRTRKLDLVGKKFQRT